VLVSRGLPRPFEKLELAQFSVRGHKRIDSVALDDMALNPGFEISAASAQMDKDIVRHG
jgi:hypothetical protein